MGKSTHLDTLSSLLSRYQAVVTYVPLHSEVPFSEYLLLTKPVLIYEIAPRVALDPLEEAAKAIQLFKEQPVVILIPGRRFDAAGTRHGRGGGWYDRFLAAVPNSWIRVGLCFNDQFSDTLLKREGWDEPLDYVCVVSDTNELNVYETHARI